MHNENKNSKLPTFRKLKADHFGDQIGPTSCKLLLLGFVVCCESRFDGLYLIQIKTGMEAGLKYLADLPE